MKDFNMIFDGSEVDYIEDLIQDEKLDIEVRSLYNVENHPIHLWESYTIGDANEIELLADAESNTKPVKKYDNVDELFDDMTEELERLALIYES